MTGFTMFARGTRAQRARQFGSVWVRLDWSLILVPLLLSLLGAVLVYSATKRTMGSELAVRHLINLAV